MGFIYSVLFFYRGVGPALDAASGEVARVLSRAGRGRAPGTQVFAKVGAYAAVALQALDVARRSGQRAASAQRSSHKDLTLINALCIFLRKFQIELLHNLPQILPRIALGALLLGAGSLEVGRMVGRHHERPALVQLPLAP